jgi:hypothetical protein
MFKLLNQDINNLILNYLKLDYYSEILYNPLIDPLFLKIIAAKKRYSIVIEEQSDFKWLKHYFKNVLSLKLAINWDTEEYHNGDKKFIIPSCLTNLTKLNLNNCSYIFVPNTLTKLRYLNCSDVCFKSLKKLPKEFVNLEVLFCGNSEINEIPETYVNLITLSCPHTNIKCLPKTLINLKYLDCFDTKIIEIPVEYKNLKYIVCSQKIIFPEFILKQLEGKDIINSLAIVHFDHTVVEEDNLYFNADKVYNTMKV